MQYIYFNYKKKYSKTFFEGVYICPNNNYAQNDFNFWFDNWKKVTCKSYTITHTHFMITFLLISTFFHIHYYLIYHVITQVVSKQYLQISINDVTHLGRRAVVEKYEKIIYDEVGSIPDTDEPYERIPAECFTESFNCDHDPTNKCCTILEQ